MYMCSITERRHRTDIISWERGGHLDKSGKSLDDPVTGGFALPSAPRGQDTQENKSRMSGSVHKILFYLICGITCTHFGS